MLKIFIISALSSVLLTGQTYTVGEYVDDFDQLKTNFDFRQTYGMTELGVVRVKSKARNSLFMKIGGEGIETRVIDNILEIRSNTRMVGYLNEESPFDKEGWYNSNDIVEVYNLLGIDAAKSLLLKEINEVIDFSGNYVNYRHLSLLCDIMTNKGSLMSIDRFGINRGNIGPLAKCSFEETTDQLFKASIFGEIDLLNGVSSNIMMGQIPPCGTGDSEIVIDESKLLDVYPQEEVELDDLDEWVKTDYCADNVGIHINSSAVSADNVSGIPEPEIEF